MNILDFLNKQKNLTYVSMDEMTKDDWTYVTKNYKLSDSEMRQYIQHINFKSLGHFQILTEDFIREFSEMLSWDDITVSQILSEEFMYEFKDKIKWMYIAVSQNLSEKFIRENKSKLFMENVAIRQKMSESLMEEKGLNCPNICTYQTLSEDFIEKHKNSVRWNIISKRQKLSEKFILKYRDRLDLYYVSMYQKLSDEALNILGLSKPENNWLYVSNEYKKRQIQSCGLYECHDDYFIAYKSVRRDRFSAYDFKNRYINGSTHEKHADHTDDIISFGLTVGTKHSIRMFCDEFAVKCKIYYKDVARIIFCNEIRVSKIEVLE